MTPVLYLPLVLASLVATDSGLHVPLGDPLQDDLDRLVVVSDAPVLKKPYNIALVTEYALRIESSYPALFKRVMQSIDQADEQAVSLRSLSAQTGAYSENREGTHHAIPNAHGQTVNSNFAGRGVALLDFGDRAEASIGLGLHRRGSSYELDFTNTYVAMGWPVCRLDIGYRDHWLSPAHGSAIAMSSNAVNSPSITLSNSVPLSVTRANYELFYSRLESTSRILSEGTLQEGRPHLLGLHVSFSPLSWLVVGGNRMMQFGGGPRDPVDVGDVLRAFFFPHRYDNRRDGLSKDEELGNQIGSLAIAANYQVAGKPVRLYCEIGADDTGSQRVYYFGNPLATVGAYVPFLTRSTSLRYEYSEGQNRWYEHAIYQDGYRNETQTMGHWIYDANQERWPFEIEASLHSLTIVASGGERELAGTARVVSVRSFSGVSYRTGIEADLCYRQDLSEQIQGEARLYAGVTPRRDDFAMLMLGLRVSP